jgi:LPS O-antigen subunit length determinant protein (WzzB/FepE family)
MKTAYILQIKITRKDQMEAQDVLFEAIDYLSQNTLLHTGEY